MSEPPEKKAKHDVVPILDPLVKKQIFDQIYGNNQSVNVENDFFNKNSNELAMENTQYINYCSELAVAEKFKSLREEKIKIALALEESEIAFELEKAEKLRFLREEKLKIEVALEESETARKALETAQSKFITKAGAGHIVDNRGLISICNELGPLLFDLVDDMLSDDQKSVVAHKIKEFLKNDSNDRKCKDLLKILNLDHFVYQNTRIPVNSNFFVCIPSKVNGVIQYKAGEDNLNYIYPFPFGITTHFPVFFCHPVFANFMDIVHNRNNVNPKVIEYKKYMIDNSCLANQFDRCIADLIVAFLDGKEQDMEIDFVHKVTEALVKVFPSSKVQSNVQVTSEISNLPQGIKLDAAVLIGDFPFIILEAKNNCYSIHAVLQGLQYYGLTTTEFIDNDPCFILTLDKGILYLYGVAKVNCRVVCSCLLSLEFTNYHFDIEGFTGTLYRCISGLYFFYKNFEFRIPNSRKD